MTAKLSLKTQLIVAFTMFFWGSAFVGIRVSLVSYSPGSMALFRFLIASFCMLLIYLGLKKRTPISWRECLKLLSLGATSIAVYHVALNQGEVTVASGIASFIVSQAPIITAVLAYFFLNERFTRLGVLGLVISFIGVFIIFKANDVAIRVELGVLYILIAALASSVYSVWQKPFLKKFHAIEVTAFLIWGGTFLLLFYLPDLWREIPKASLLATASVVYLGIFPAAIAYLGWSYVLSKMSASRATNYLYFMPIISSLMGWWLLGEVPAPMALFGCVIALVGVWVVNYSHARR